MEKIATYKKTLEIIKTHNFNIKKNYGQNFLTDSHVLTKIVEGAGVCPEDTVVEIGPGLGGMTELLSERAKFVYAVEIDDKLTEILRITLKNCENVKIINGDIMKTDISSLTEGRIKVVANLPYYISTPVIMSLLENRYDIDSITVMVQKEVGDRLRAVPGSKDYGALSIAASYYADIYLVANVPRNCFYPRPNVDSEVLRLTVREPLVFVSSKAFMFKIIRAAFALRRKTLVNCLFAAEDIELSKSDLVTVIKLCGFSDTVRGEELSIFDFAVLSDKIMEFLEPHN